MDWDTISYVMSGKLRFRILVELKDSQKTPTDLVNAVGDPMSHISKTLRELEEKNLIQCLTPQRRKLKFYTITDKGKETLNEISKITTGKEE